MATRALAVPFEEGLSRFGYGLAPDVEVSTKDVVTAFQRHFRTSKLDGEWDHDCGRRLAGLLALL
jgi:N-acetylmuramoyl-L-alanine amidase